MTTGTGLPAFPGRAVLRLFERVADLPPQERVALLDAECPDTEMRAQVDALLSAHDALASGISERARFLRALDHVHAASLLANGDADRLTAFDDLPDRIGRYRMIRPLGRGGMGVVGVAHDADLDRLVAIKLLQRDVSTDPDARTRFLTEARAASALDHPAIATIYEIGETEDGRLFIVMSYHGDTTLRARLAEGPLTVPEAVRIAMDVAEGLCCAHERGIVHRDIKPANLIVERERTTRIIDFGLAKLAGHAITQPELRLGTAAYMSPEQTRGDPIDGRTDVWSLGVVLYEMLAGARPFRHESLEGMVYAIRHDPPAPLTEDRPEIPSPLAAIVSRCLAKEPRLRFQTADELLRALRALPEERTQQGLELRLRRMGKIAAAGVATGVMALAAVVASRPPDGGGATATPTASIAVLPFSNLGSQRDDAYLADGITEDVLSTLGQLRGLRVAGRTSSPALRERADAGEVGRRLGVRYVLDGSVQRAGERLRVVVRLVDAAEGVQIWTRRYDREIAELFVLEDEISRAVAGALELKVLPLDDRTIGLRRTANLEAHDMYLRGRYAWNRRTEDGFREAVTWFRAAIARDSAYAAAYAGLSDAYRLLGTYGFLPGSETFAEAASAARRAVSLAPRSGEAHAALAGTLQAQGRYREADQAFRRAISLDPDHAHARHWYAFLLATLGRIEEAQREMTQARALDPFSLSIRVTEARLKLHAGDAGLAIASLEDGISMDSTNPWAWYVLALAKSRQDRRDEAIAAVRAGLERVPGEPRLAGAHAALTADAGDTLSALAILDRLRRTSNRESIAYGLATAFAALGQPDSAFAWLGRVAWNSEYLFSLRTDPLLDPLRSDPRYRALGIELGIPGWP